MWHYPEALTLGHFCFPIKECVSCGSKAESLLVKNCDNKPSWLVTPPPFLTHMTGTYDSAFQHKRVKSVDHVTWHEVKEFSRSQCVKSGWAPGQQPWQTKCQCGSKLWFIPFQYILSFVWWETVKTWRGKTNLLQNIPLLCSAKHL